jgi:hypothetical protein
MKTLGKSSINRRHKLDRLLPVCRPPRTTAAPDRAPRATRASAPFAVARFPVRGEGPPSLRRARPSRCAMTTRLAFDRGRPRMPRDGPAPALRTPFDFSHSLGQQLPPALQKWSGKLLAIRYARKRRPCAGMLNYLRRSRIGYRHWFSQKRVVFRPLRRRLICRRQRLRPPYAVPGHAKGRQGLRSHATGTAWRTAALRVKWRRDSLLQPRRNPRS